PPARPGERWSASSTCPNSYQTSVSLLSSSRSTNRWFESRQLCVHLGLAVNQNANLVQSLPSSEPAERQPARPGPGERLRAQPPAEAQHTVLRSRRTIPDG